MYFKVHDAVRTHMRVTNSDLGTQRRFFRVCVEVICIKIFGESFPGAQNLCMREEDRDRENECFKSGKKHQYNMNLYEGGEEVWDGYER